MQRTTRPGPSARRILGTLALTIAIGAATTAATAAPIPGITLGDGDYGQVGHEADLPSRYVTLTNSGAAPVAIGPYDGFVITGPDAKRFSIFDATDCSNETATLAPGASCRIGINARADKLGATRATLTSAQGDIGELRISTYGPTIRKLRLPKVAPRNGKLRVFRLSCPKPARSCSFHSSAGVELPGRGSFGIWSRPAGPGRISGGRSVDVYVPVNRARGWLCSKRVRGFSVSASISLLSGRDRSGTVEQRTTVRVRPYGCTPAERDAEPKVQSGQG